MMAGFDKSAYNISDELQLEIPSDPDVGFFSEVKKTRKKEYRSTNKCLR